MWRSARGVSLLLASSLHTMSLLHRSCDDGQEIRSRTLSQVWSVKETALVGERTEEGLGGEVFFGGGEHKYDRFEE
jgi:hypothetical protein